MQKLRNRSPQGGQLDHVLNPVQGFVVNEPSGAEVVLDFVLGLENDRVRHQLGSDQGGEDASGKDHEEKAEDEFGAQRKTIEERNPGEGKKSEDF